MKLKDLTAQASALKHEGGSGTKEYLFSFEFSTVLPKYIYTILRHENTAYKIKLSTNPQSAMFKLYRLLYNLYTKKRSVEESLAIVGLKYTKL